jgi:hypothetical protein
MRSRLSRLRLWRQKSHTALRTTHLFWCGLRPVAQSISSPLGRRSALCSIDSPLTKVGHYLRCKRWLPSAKRLEQEEFALAGAKPSKCELAHNRGPYFQKMPRAQVRAHFVFLCVCELRHTPAPGIGYAAERYLPRLAPVANGGFFLRNAVRDHTSRPSPIPLQLPLAPMRLFAIGVEYAFAVSVQRLQHADARQQKPAAPVSVCRDTVLPLAVW